MPTTATSKIDKVYGAIAKVLAALSVEKGGVLPGNMGSGAYIRASDLSSEVKRQFVDKKLILLPNEKFTLHESVEAGGRTKIIIGCEGTYTIVSTEDGSSATISGIGDGIATGTAVGSNIASTNALKNALLRTFLVTETSVEDQAKNGIGDDKPTAKSASAPAPKVDNAKAVELQNQIREAAVPAQNYGKIGARIAAERGVANWSADIDVLNAVLAEVKSGVTE